MKPFRVLITDRFEMRALALLKSRNDLALTLADQPIPTDSELTDTEGLLIRSRTRVDAALLARAPRLKVVISSTSGFDHIDLTCPEFNERGIRVMHTPEANANSACEMTWALLLACARQIPDAQKAVKAGSWRPATLSGVELAHKTLGIVGLGRIGSRVARVAQAFGMKTVAFDPYRDEEWFNDRACARVSFDELLKISDVVSFHVPATLETRHMLSAMALESMAPHAIVINTSRGAIVRETDLVQALQQGWISSLGLDVYEREPLARDSRLMALERVVLSPHLGASTAEAFAASSREAAEKLVAFVQHQTVSDPLPPNEAWYGSRS